MITANLGFGCTDEASMARARKLLRPSFLLRRILAGRDRAGSGEVNTLAIGVMDLQPLPSVSGKEV